jgi:hypothetical protein
MANDIIDINVYETTETVAITVNPNLTTVNINEVVGVIPQNLQEVTNVGSTTTNSITANSFIKSGGTGTNILLDNGSIIALASVGGNTNLTPSQTSTNFTINSDTGTDATIPLGNGTLAGASLNNYTTAEQTKLAGIASGAEVNVNADWNATSGDAQILNKPTIPTQTSQLTNNGSDGTNPFITALDIPTAGQAGTLVREVKNMTGATLNKGTVVYISGANGNKALVSKALATTDALSARTFGLLQSNISNNGVGYCVIIGDLTGLDTSAYTEGVQLYLSGVTAGTYTSTKTLAPTHLVYIGKVTRSHPILGQIEVGIQNGYELEEIHDCQITTPLNNDGLFYEVSTDLWKNKSISTVLGYTPANDASVVHLSGDTMTGSLILNANPTVAFGAVTKSYVDTLINGIDWKTSANAATTTSLPTYTVSGSGQILTGTVTLGLIDGVTLTANQRLLVKNETLTLRPNNGIYTVTQVNPFILTRSSDANTSALLAEATISISGGDTLSNTQWHCNPASIPTVIGTTNISFVGIGANAYTFNSPLINTSNVISILDASASQNGAVTTGIQTFAGKKTFSPSVTASSALAQGTILTPTLSATANSDTLIGLDITPTFTNGAFTNVTNLALRVNGATRCNITPTSTNVGKEGSAWTSTNTFGVKMSVGQDYFTSRSMEFGYYGSGETAFQALKPNTGYISTASGASQLSLNTNTTSQPITFSTGDWLERMRVFGNGNISMGGGNSPTDDGINRLQVTGSIKSTSVNGATAAEMAYLSGVTSAIQTQFSNKQPLATVLTNTTASYTTAEQTKLGKYPSTATNGTILQGNGTSYVEIATPTGTTNLGYTAASAIGTITSSTGTSATLPLADATNAGLFSPTEKSKLTGIATGATANSSDATLLARANHTGTQTASTISDIQTTITNNTSVLANTAKISFDSTSSTRLANTSGTNTGDQDLSTLAPKASPTFTGTVVLPSTTSIGTVTSTEIGYLDNVTSSIQTQLDNKIAKNVGATYTTNTITTVTTAAYALLVSAGTTDANTLYFII